MRDETLDRLRTAALDHSPGGRVPWACQWELTCRCNLRCVMCYTDCFNTAERIHEELSTSEILRILCELHEAGCVELTFTGGEPFARPDFRTIYREAHRLGFVLTIFSNGTLITAEVADELAIRPPRSVEISVHGLSSEVFDGVTQIPGSLERCMAGIRLLHERHIAIVLKTVGLAVNSSEIVAVKRFAESLGGSVVWRFGQYLRDDLVQSGMPYRLQLSEADLRALERTDSDLWKAKREEIAGDETIVERRCGGGRVSFHIDARGQLQLCSNNRRAGYDLRTGSFRQGFYEALPNFPCPSRTSNAQPVLSIAPPSLAR